MTSEKNTGFYWENYIANDGVVHVWIRNKELGVVGGTMLDNKGAPRGEWTHFCPWRETTGTLEQVKRRITLQVIDDFQQAIGELRDLANSMIDPSTVVNRSNPADETHDTNNPEPQ